jgi:hypothetical protein
MSSKAPKCKYQRKSFVESTQMMENGSWIDENRSMSRSESWEMTDSSHIILSELRHRKQCLRGEQVHFPKEQGPNFWCAHHLGRLKQYEDETASFVLISLFFLNYLKFHYNFSVLSQYVTYL